jgi:hypothetical protein
MPTTPDRPDDNLQSNQTGNQTGNQAGNRTSSQGDGIEAASEGGGAANDDAYDTDVEAEEDMAPAHSFSDMVRQSPITAVAGAFMAGFLVSRIL